MKRLAAAIALGCFLSITTLAGDIPSVPGPQPSPAAGEIPSVPGDIATPGIADQLSEEALSALLGFLSF